MPKTKTKLRFSIFEKREISGGADTRASIRESTVPFHKSRPFT